MSALGLLSDIIATFQRKQVEELQYDVIIVGGGPAGIAAARKLAENHIKCCILEAREGLGGRVCSDYWEDNISIDYGAQWIHHVPSNRQHLFVNLAKDELNIDLENEFLQKESVESRRYHRKRLIWDEMSKQEIPSSIYTKITHSARYALKKQVLNYNFSRNINHKNYSIYDVFKDYYNKIMIGLPNELQSMQQFSIDMNDNSNIKQLDVSLMERCIDKTVCIHECADGPITEESLYHWNDDTLGGYNIYMQGKYGQFIKMIGNTLDKNSVDIRYRNIVKSVEYNHEQKCNDFKMKVIAKDSRLDIMRKYKAKHVIICIPIGCLQSRTIEFIPRLKDTFWRSIDNGIGITNCNKLILQFDGQFPMKNEVTTINIISKQDGYKPNKSIPAENQNYGFGHRMGIDYKDRKMYNIWVIFISQHFWSREINDDEKMDNNEEDVDIVRRQNDVILKETVNIFKDMFGGKNMEFPKVKRYYVTRWDIDEYSRGCWCFMKNGGNGSIDCDAILNANDIFDIESKMDDNNVEKRLQFAGEYVRGDGIGTVYAAFVAGSITANNILDINQR